MKLDGSKQTPSGNPLTRSRDHPWDTIRGLTYTLYCSPGHYMRSYTHTLLPPFWKRYPAENYSWEFYFSGRLEVWRVSFVKTARRDDVFILCHCGHGLNEVEEWSALGVALLRLFNAGFFFTRRNENFWRFVAENGVQFVWGEYGQCAVNRYSVKVVDVGSSRGGVVELFVEVPREGEVVR